MGPSASPEDRAHGLGSVNQPTSATDAKEPPLGPISKGSMRGHKKERAWRFADGEAEPIEVGRAEASGYTVIDLGDHWTPYIFSHQTAGAENLSPNQYAARYIDLANDRTDSDGEALDPHEHNYLELYGLPPSLGLILRDFEAAGDLQRCLDEAGYQPRSSSGSIGASPSSRERVQSD